MSESRQKLSSMAEEVRRTDEAVPRFIRGLLGGILLLWSIGYPVIVAF